MKSGVVISFTLPSGGGGVPDWVPTGAKFHVDFLNDRAWSEAAGIVTIDTIFGADANTQNAWGTQGVYDPATHLDANGYANGLPTFDGVLAFIGEARTKILDTATFVLRFWMTATDTGNNSASNILLAAADGNDALEIDLKNDRGFEVYSWNGTLDETQPSILNYSADGGAINVVAITVASDTLLGAANGSSVIGGALTDTDRPAANPMVAAFIDAFANRLQTVTIYDPVIDHTALAALSVVP